MSTAHRPVTEKRKNNHKSIKDTKEKKREGVGGKISKVPKFFLRSRLSHFLQEFQQDSIAALSLIDLDGHAEEIQFCSCLSKQFF
jgi:hypothetical protein